MTWYRVGPAGIPGSLKTDMDTVLNKKFGTSTTYPPNTWPDNVNLLGPLPEKTASGAIAHIEDGADGVPLKNWLVTLPASLDGYTEVNGYKQGANVIDYTSNLTTGTSGGLTFSVTADGGISYSGTASSTFAYVTAKFDFSIKSGQTFTFSRNTAFSYIHRITLTFSDDTTANVSISANDTSATYTPAKDVKAVRLLVAGLTTSTSYNDTVYLQTEYGSTATAYTAYEAPTTATASLGRTIYGGTADIVTGEGSETYPTIKISDLTFVKDANCQHTFMCTNLPRKYGFGIYNIFSSAFTTYTSGNSTGSNIASLEVGNDNTIFLNGGSARFYITADSSYDNKSASDFVADFANTLLIYEASTPTPFTFTPITPTPETALGVSNWWADEGDSDVTYRADISLALQALGGGGRGLMGMMMQRPEEEQLTEEDPEEVPEEEAETNER